MAEYFEKEALIREIISDMASFVGDPDAVQKHDERCNYAISCIESAPVADVAPVIRATWVLTTDFGPSELYHCSRCGREEVRFGKSSIYKQYPYCHCGAKMDGGADDDTGGNV